MSVETGKFLDVTNDYAFKVVFGSEEHKSVTISMLNSLMRLNDEHKIKEITFLDKEYLPEREGLKRSIVDVRCKDESDKIFIIEMQRGSERALFIKRVQVEVARGVSVQAPAGDQKLTSVHPVKMLMIVDFDIIKKDEDYINHYDTMNRKTGYRHFDLMSYVVVNLIRYKEHKERGKLTTVQEQELEWLELLSYSKDADSIPEGVTSEVEEAYHTLEMSNFTTEQLEAYNRVALEIGQYYATVEGAKEEGREEGREEGEAIGMEKGKIEMAKAMLGKIWIQKLLPTSPN